MGVGEDLIDNLQGLLTFRQKQRGIIAEGEAAMGKQAQRTRVGTFEGWRWKWRRQDGQRGEEEVGCSRCEGTDLHTRSYGLPRKLLTRILFFR